MASGQNSRSTKTQCDPTIPETYTRLTEEERYQIYEGVTEKRSHRKIATLINKRYCQVNKLTQKHAINGA
jgi:IS30 family transposase